MPSADLTADAIGRAQDAGTRWMEAEGRARQCLLDWLGVVLASRTAGGDVPAIGAEVERGATELATGRTLPAAEAALGTAMHAHRLDFDDFHTRVPGHASAPVIAAALAVAEERDASLGDVLRAIVVGTELAVSLGERVGDALFARGWHPTAVLGAMGAAAAAASVRRLDAPRMHAAIGFAALQASGSMAGFGTLGKSWQVGCAARDGVHAAAAADGTSGALPDLLSSRHGVLALMLGETGATGAAVVPREALAIQDTQFKYYSTCFGTHAAIDAMRALVEGEGGVAAAEVAAIEVRVSDAFEHVVINPRPTTTLAAKFSVSSVVALAALGRPPLAADFFDDRVAADPEYRRLEAAVLASAAPHLAGGDAEVTVTERDGTTSTHLQRESRPEPVDDAWPRLETKVRALGAPVLGEQGVAELVAWAAHADLDGPASTAASLMTTEASSTIGAPR